MIYMMVNARLRKRSVIDKVFDRKLQSRSIKLPNVFDDVFLSLLTVDSLQDKN